MLEIIWLVTRTNCLKSGEVNSEWLIFSKHFTASTENCQRLIVTEGQAEMYLLAVQGKLKVR